MNPIILFSFNEGKVILSRQIAEGSANILLHKKAKRQTSSKITETPQLA